MKHREVRIHAEFKGEVSPENRRWLVRRVATRAVFYADRDHTVIFDCPKRRLELYREEIRRVLDMGDYYYLDIPSQSGRGMVCQKSLMTIGTEETFEKLFDGKIERKGK